MGAAGVLLGAGFSCQANQKESNTMISEAVEAFLDSVPEEVALVYQDLGGSGFVEVLADERMHAASTMKIPVMIQIYQDHQDGLLSLDDSIMVRTRFASIVDGSPYDLSAGDDSDDTLYAMSGKKVSYRHLIDLMITVSSNLATNILIEEAGAERVTVSMRALGADSIQVLRGVEDGPAFRAGLSNTTTARDLATILSALARGEVVSQDASEEMLEVLRGQKWRTKIPAQLPPGVTVAHKTGRITGISHDAGVVFPPDGSPYTVVILTRGFDDPEEADRVAATLSRLVFDHHQLER
jgi:beta-lactamase class A